MSDFFKRLIFGLIIGIAGIIPGLSGGVIAAAMGLYEPTVIALTGLFKEPKKNACFLLPFLIGAAAGVLLFSNVVGWLMDTAANQVLFLFFGLVGGSIPSVLKEANAKGFRLRYIGAFMIAMIFVLALDYLGSITTSVAQSATWDMKHEIFYGMIMALGTIVPGISFSFILIYFGAYAGLLAAIAAFDFAVLGPIVLGFIIAAIPLIKLVEIFFRKHHGASYYAVLGFLIASMVVVFPGLAEGWQLFRDMLLLCLGILASFMLLRLNHQ